MNDNIKEYVDRGEVDYIGKTDSVSVAGGKERILINWLVNRDPRIESCIIYWNDKADSAIFPVDRSKLVNGRMSVVLNNMPEGKYVFLLYHTGQSGHRSIVSEVSGSVYGEKYQSSIGIRRMVDLSVYATGDGEINWSFASESVVKTVFTYDVPSGGQDNIVVLPEDNHTVLGSYILGGKYKSVTYHIPEQGAIDTFYVESEGQLPSYYLLDKTGWLPYVSSTSYSDDARTVGLLDNNPGTAWISSYNQGYSMTEKPLYVEFDMLNEKQVNIVRVIKHNNTKELEVRTSMNRTDWTTVGVIGEDDTDDGGVAELVLEQPVRARHIRLYVTRSANDDGRGGLYEVDIKGSNIESPTSPAIFRYDREGWEVLSVQSAAGNRPMETMLDGNPESFWVPKWEGVREVPPYWAVIDIVEAKEFTKILFYRRQRNSDTRTVQFYTGPSSDPDASSWTYLGEHTFPERNGTFNSDEIAVIDVPDNTNTAQGRYLKLLLPNTWNEYEPSSAIAEVYLYGKVR
jgi:hypothetical protein